MPDSRQTFLWKLIKKKIYIKIVEIGSQISGCEHRASVEKNASQDL